MDLCDLQSLYLSDMQELCNCETQLMEGLPIIAMSAGSAELRMFIRQHAKQAALHEQRIKTILHRHKNILIFDLNRVIAEMVEKGHKIRCLIDHPDLRDAALVTLMRYIAHHEIVAYNTILDFAGTLSLRLDRRSLFASLEEKIVADCKFADLQIAVNKIALLANSTPNW